MIEFAQYLKLLVALLAIVDVVGNIPFFLQRTSHLSVSDRVVVAVTAGVATAVILFLFAMFGKSILQAFGISIAAFKLLGGLVILLIALQMLGLTAPAGGVSDEERSSGALHPVSIGMFPMAVPSFAGPGAISAVMVYAHEGFHSNHDLIVTLVIAAAAMVVVVGLSIASVLGQFIGPITQTVINRLLGIIVGALGVEFILDGIATFFPALAA
ncbi:MAG: MarC family protein [Hyphomicrobiaceae bacterium]